MIPACVILRRLPVLLTLLSVGVAARAEYVSKEDFEAFKQQLEVYKNENQKLKSKTESLEQTVEQLKNPAPAAKIESRANAVLTGATQNSTSTEFTARTKFLITGWADSGFSDRSNANSSFQNSFHPVFLWKMGERTSFETDFNFATLAYHINDYVTFETGQFLTPFGTFIRRDYPTWINKLPTQPLAFDFADGLVPPYTLGAMLDGGFHAGPTKFNWAAYVGNGPSLKRFAFSADYGQLEFNNGSDANQGKAFGGRIGFLPIPELEIGASAQTSRVGPNHTALSKTDNLLYGVDLSFNRDFNAIKGTIDLRFEQAWSRTDDASYQGGAGLIALRNNNRNGGYARFAYRPGMVSNKVLRKFEAAFRYDRLAYPSATPDDTADSLAFRGDRERLTYSLNYWLTSATVLKLSYEDDSKTHSSYMFQISIGF